MLHVARNLISIGFGHPHTTKEISEQFSRPAFESTFLNQLKDESPTRQAALKESLSKLGNVMTEAVCTLTQNEALEMRRFCTGEMGRSQIPKQIRVRAFPIIKMMFSCILLQVLIVDNRVNSTMTTSTASNTEHFDGSEAARAIYFRSCLSMIHIPVWWIENEDRLNLLRAALVQIFKVAPSQTEWFRDAPADASLFAN